MKDKDIGYVAPPIEKQLSAPKESFQKGFGCGCAVGLFIGLAWAVFTALRLDGIL